MSKKNTTIVLSLIGTLALYVLFNTRQTGFCNIYCGPAIDQFQSIFFLFPLILFFSLLTYKMPERVFSTWWNFAKYAIPTSLVALIAVSLGVLHGDTAGSAGLGGFVNDALDLTAMGIIYGLFTLGSIIQIIRGYLRK